MKRVLERHLIKVRGSSLKQISGGGIEKESGNNLGNEVIRSAFPTRFHLTKILCWCLYQMFDCEFLRYMLYQLVSSDVCIFAIDIPKMTFKILFIALYLPFHRLV